MGLRIISIKIIKGMRRERTWQARVNYEFAIYENRPPEYDIIMDSEKGPASHRNLAAGEWFSYGNA